MCAACVTGAATSTGSCTCANPATRRGEGSRSRCMARAACSREPWSATSRACATSAAARTGSPPRCGTSRHARDPHDADPRAAPGPHAQRHLHPARAAHHHPIALLRQRRRHGSRRPRGGRPLVRRRRSGSGQQVCRGAGTSPTRSGGGCRKSDSVTPAGRRTSNDAPETLAFRAEQAETSPCLRLPPWTNSVVRLTSRLAPAFAWDCDHPCPAGLPRSQLVPSGR